MNAIILAAGMGTRLRPLTDDRPKALIEVMGESFFARQVRQLREIDVRDITVVTGYKGEAFAPWRKEPGLRFVHNEHYADRNNLWSMNLVRERLGDTYVLDGDVRLAEGVFPYSAPVRSCWFVGFRDDMRNEWVVRTADDDDRVIRVDVASGSGWILSGLSYWTKDDGVLLGRLVDEMTALPGFEQLYWDEAPRRCLDRIDVRARHIGSGDWAEIDTLADKKALEALLSVSLAR